MTDSKTATLGKKVDMVVYDELQSDGKTATQRLREMLDERGVKWKNVGGTTSSDGITEWFVDGMTCQAVNRVTVGIEHLTLHIPVLTPEQAIATLGAGECEITPLKDGYYRTAAVECSACHSAIATADIEYDCTPINYCPHCGRKAVKR